MEALPSVSYPTDLTDRAWALLEPLLLSTKTGECHTLLPYAWGNPVGGS